MVGVERGEVWSADGHAAVAGAYRPVAAALVDVAHGYVAVGGGTVPVEVAHRHSGVPGPGWLAVVALVRGDVRRLASDTLELATAAEVPTPMLGDCVDYVFLAACLLAGWPVEQAVETVTSAPAVSGGPLPPLTGETMPDALAASVWALTQGRSGADVLDALGEVTTPGVTAAVGGVLGLRDGPAALARERRWPRRRAAEHAVLVSSLLGARHHADPVLSAIVAGVPT
ncbi:MAG: hypothetical protein ACRD2C_09575 [Acidimicrobiales bacterium]